MSICECPTCQEVKKEHWTCKHYDDRYEPQLYPCDKCRDYSNWEAKAAVVERLEDPDLVEVDANLDCPLDHAALAAEHWDGFTGPLIDRVAEAVKKVAQLGGEEDETNRAIDAVVKALRFMALSHWAHGAKHERERQ